MTISKKKDITNVYKYEIEEIHAINWDIREYIISCPKESELCAVYTEQSTAYFDDIENITLDSANVILQEKKNGSEEYFQANTYDKNEVNNSI